MVLDILRTKYCKHCQQTKNITEFQKCANRKSGVQSRCRICRNEAKRLYLSNHPDTNKIMWVKLKEEFKTNPEKHEKRLLIGKKYNIINKSKSAIYRKQYNIINRDRRILYGKKYRKQHPETAKKYYQDNKTILISKMNVYKSNRLNQYPSLKILKNLRKRVWESLLNANKSDNTKNLLGCDEAFLKQYIENQFTEGMSWENYGNTGWHIDHIIPCAFFQDYLNDPIEQKLCFHYSNLRPLWAVDNMMKHDNIEGLKLLYNDPTPFV